MHERPSTNTLSLQSLLQLSLGERLVLVEELFFSQCAQELKAQLERKSFDHTICNKTNL